MKSFRFFTKSLIFVLILSAFAFAQTEKTQTSAALRVAEIDTTVFFDKEKGINELVQSIYNLEIEFKPEKDELRVLSEMILKLQKELQELNDLTKFDVDIKKLKDSVDKKLNEYELNIEKYKKREQEI